MTKYVANPVIVDAYTIKEVIKAETGAEYNVTLGDEGKPDFIETTKDCMCARYAPQVGDYWVIQSDGYIYLNPKEVFERKYSPVAVTEQQAA